MSGRIIDSKVGPSGKVIGKVREDRGSRPQASGLKDWAKAPKAVDIVAITTKIFDALKKARPAAVHGGGAPKDAYSSFRDAFKSEAGRDADSQDVGRFESAWSRLQVVR